MDRKSTKKGYSPGRRKGHCCLCTASALALFVLLTGCICLEQQDHLAVRQNQVLAEARGYLLEGDEDLAIEALKEEVANGTKRCMAAFYLYFLDSAKNDYLEILNNPVCKTEHPLNDSIVQKYLAAVKKQEKCTKDRRLLKRKINSLSTKLTNAEKERKRLLFELKKLEQIRRETEKLRLKK